MDAHSHMMQMRIGLTIVRALQVALAMAACIVNLKVLANNGRRYDMVKRNIYDDVDGPGPIYTIDNAFGHTTVNRIDADDLENRAAGLLAGSIIELFVNFITLVLTLSLLVVTTNAKSRAGASCCGNSRACAHFHADMGIDVMLAVFYFILFILSLTFGAFPFAMAYTAAFVALSIVSAVLSGETRRVMHEAYEARTQSRPSPLVNQRMSFVDRLDPDQAKDVKPMPPKDENDLEV